MERNHIDMLYLTMNLLQSEVKLNLSVDQKMQ